jgi:hypothetical protein
VPSPANPQSLNRHSYVVGNPLVYVDPTGHRQICNPQGTICGDDEGTVEPHSVEPGPPPMPDPTNHQAVLHWLRDLPCVQVTENADGTYIITSLGNPPFTYPREVDLAGYILRAEAMGEQARSGDPRTRQESSASVVWVMRNMVELGRCWSGRAMTAVGACQSLTNPQDVCTACKNRYPTYSGTARTFNYGSESYPEDKAVALRVFLGQIPDPTNGAVYMVNHEYWGDLPQGAQEAQTYAVTWRTGGVQYGHHFYTFEPDQWRP